MNASEAGYAVEELDAIVRVGTKDVLPKLAWENSYAAMVVDLEIDKLTYEIIVRNVVTAQDVGKAINPLFVEGQIIGGTSQALGYALLENAIFDRGVMQNAQLTNYIIPTTLDMPPMDVTIVEKPYSKGPFGAKGVGEAPYGCPRSDGGCSRL